MAKKPASTEAEQLSMAIVQGMKEKKASDIVVIDLRPINNSIADFFIVCSGGSDNQVEAIADSVEKEVFKNFKENPVHVEGKQNKKWMLIDYINVVAHVFQKSERSFYDLENLWGDAKITVIENS